MRRTPGIVEETPWWLDVNGVRTAGGTVTPDRIEMFVAGRLLVEGYISSGADILSLSIIYDPRACIGVRAAVSADLANGAETARSHRLSHGCGARHFLDCGGQLPAREPTTNPTLFPLGELFRELYMRADQRYQAGGIHTVGLTDGTSLLCQVEDIGRHNAVDKTIGWAVLEGVDRSSLGLILSARVSAEIALKAARAGLAWVASRSIPTDLAVEIATAAGLPILARATGKDARIFGVSDRSLEASIAMAQPLETPEPG